MLHICSDLSGPVRTCPQYSDHVRSSRNVIFLHFRMLLFFGLTSYPAEIAYFKATFPAVHFDARKSPRAGAFASATGKDFVYRTHTVCSRDASCRRLRRITSVSKKTPARAAFLPRAVPRHSSKTMHSKAIENFQKQQK